MEFPKTREVAIQLCKIIGLNPNQVTEFSIRFEADQLIKVDATIVPSSDQMDGSLKALEASRKHFVLSEIKTDE